MSTISTCPGMLTIINRLFEGYEFVVMYIQACCKSSSVIVLAMDNVY